MGDEADDRAGYRPDRYYILSDAGSQYWDPTTSEGAGGFETAEAAAEWARRQTTWAYGSELDFSDGVAAIIARGDELSANEAAWDAWDGEGDWPDAPAVRNYARGLGLVTDPEP